MKQLPRENPFDDYSLRHKLYSILEDEPSLITVLRNQYITDDMWKFCIQKDTSLFQEMKNPSEDMCIFALKEDGSNLKYITSKFKNIKITPKMVWVAVSSNPTAIFYVPEEYRTEELKEHAYTLDPSLMEYSEYIRPAYLKKVIREHPEYIKYVRNPDEELVCEAIAHNPNICAYLAKFTPRMKELVRQLYPELFSLIPRLRENNSSNISLISPVDFEEGCTSCQP